MYMYLQVCINDMVLVDLACDEYTCLMINALIINN